MEKENKKKIQEGQGYSQKRRYQNDPEYRRRKIDMARRYNEEHKEERNEYLRNYRRKRYHEDPEYREKVQTRNRRYCKERYHSDPEYRARKLRGGKKNG